MDTKNTDRTKDRREEKKINEKSSELLTDKMIRCSLEHLKGHKTVTSEEVPDIPLYMDQVLTLMDRFFPQEGNDHAFTKTMINNYVKSGLLPAPEKKKYSADHIYMLSIIYYMKNILKIDEIDEVLKAAAPDSSPRKKQTSTPPLADIKHFYEAIYACAKQHLDAFAKSLNESNEEAKAAFKDDGTGTAHLEDKQFALLIALLSFDAWLRKYTAETMIEQYRRRAKNRAAHKKEQPASK